MRLILRAAYIRETTVIAAREEQDENMWGEQPCRHPGQDTRRGRKCSRHGAEIPCSPWWGSCVPAAHGGHRDAQIHLQPMERPTPEQEGGCEPVGSPCWNRVLAGTWRPMERGAHTGAGVLAGFVTLGEPMLEQGVPENTACCGRVSHIGEVSHGRYPTLQQEQPVMNWPLPPFPISLCCWGGVGRGWKERRGGGKVFLSFILILIILLWFFYWSIQLVSLTLACFVHASIWWVISPVLISAHELLLYFLSRSAEKGIQSGSPITVVWPDRGLFPRYSFTQDSCPVHFLWQP